MILIEKKIILIKLVKLALLVTSLAAYSSHAQENFVELGRQKSISSFYEKEASEITESFKIPIYNKQDQQKNAVLWSPQSSTQRTPASKTEKVNASKKSRATLRLEARLKNLRIIPIPKYKFGKEKAIGRNDLGWDSKKYANLGSFKLKVTRLPSLLKNISKSAKVDIKSAVQKQLNIKSPNQTVVVNEDVNNIQFIPEPVKEFTLLSLYLKEPKDLDLLTADILFQEKDSCEEVTPLTEYLKDKPTKDFRTTYYRGMCLHRDKMYTESIPLLADVIGKSTEYYAMNAVSEILRDLPKGYEPIIADGLAPKKVYNKLKQAQKDKYNYILGKGYFIKENFKRAEVHSKIVSAESADYYDAQFLLATSQYMSGKLPEGIKTISNLKDMYFKKSNTSDEFKSLIHITYARFLFERGIYDKAIDEYSKVNRSHPLWVDSLIEKGWAQLQTGDFKGAIGNMFTLKSPFFKDAYIPEAQVIQTIGYLNICQFADADQTLTYLEATYPQQKESILDFVKADKSYYETLTTYIGQDTSKIYEYEGLPTSIIREMGRDREYLDVQQKLNNIVDEIPRFNTFIQKLLKKANELSAQLSVLTVKSKELRLKESEAIKDEDPELAKSLKAQRQKVYESGLSTNFRIAEFNKGIKAFKEANKNAVDRAIKLRDEYLTLAENNLKESMSNIDVRLDLVLRNNDLLRYEVYANSGQNIRYRTAGGEVQETTQAQADRLPTNVVADKDYGWSFKGEFWEDEIGNFRSKLKNLCPKEN